MPDMRTKEECREMLRECRWKLDFWRKSVWELEGKELEYPHRLEEYKSQRELWSQRVETLEYVLGLRDYLK